MPKKSDNAEPNKWCPVPGLPKFMYSPLPPKRKVDPLQLKKHLDHWITTNDWDDEKQEGFWLYSAYKKALPKEYAFLADRIMNLSLAFPDGYEAALKDTVESILSICPTTFDWEPYLDKKFGTQRLTY